MTVSYLIETIINDPSKYKYSKPIVFQVNHTYNVYHFVSLCGKENAHFITSSRVIAYY